MRSIGFKFGLLAIFMAALLTACTNRNGEPPAATPPSSPETASTPDALVPTGSGPSATPNAIDTQPAPAATQTLPEVDWREVPIMPEVSQNVLRIYQEGQALGRDPDSFSVIGDCQSIPFVFLGPFSRDEQAPDSAESYLWDAINQFKPSFIRWSVTSRGGFTAASILNPLQADPHYCQAGEAPLTCEYRLQNPAFIFITLETWLDPNSVDRYESYLRRILDYVIEKGTVPILITKADASEVTDGTQVINPAIVRVARDYDVPVINFWRAAQYLDNHGIDPERGNFHLSPAGYELKNILALRALYSVWQAVGGESAGGNTPGSTNLTPTSVAQTGPGSDAPPQVTAPDCSGGCIFFGTAASHDGAMSSQGVYAYAYSQKKLTPVLGAGFDLQDVSGDGRRLLVNNGDRLYEVSLADGSASLVSDSFYFFGHQGAYWNSDESSLIYIDRDRPVQTDTGQAINLFPSTRDQERYFESGECTAPENCRSGGVYRLNADQTTTPLNYLRPVFSPRGDLVAYLNPAAATAQNYYHIGYMFTEDPGAGIASRRIFYFPQEHGFMIYPEVRQYAFSPDGNQLFIIYDVYSAYFESSQRIQTYLVDIRTGILYEYGKLTGGSGSLDPHLVWSPEQDKVLFFLIDGTADDSYSLSVYQTLLNTDQRLVLYDPGILTSSDYFHITNIYWR